MSVGFQALAASMSSGQAEEAQTISVIALQQHIVARPRPRLVQEVGVLGVDAGVVEEVDGGPAAARLDPEGASAALKLSVQLTWPG